MRIALVHSFYRSDVPSGENAVVLRQVDALRSAGHEVLLVSRYSDAESRAFAYPARSAVRVALGTGADPTPELRAFGPDVVHVHNTFPNLGERWLQRWDRPVVVTLHNFRPVCANALLYRAGNTCTRCVGASPLPAVRYGCYRGSRSATLPLAIHNAGGLTRNRLLRAAARVIVLSERSRQLFAAAGDEHLARKMVVVPNGVEDRLAPAAPTPGHWAFVGRLSSEKGIQELIEAWPAGERLRVAGDGPLLEGLRSLAGAGVSLEGPLPGAAVDELLRGAWGLVLPSRCFEGFPTVVAEAAMHAVPIVARAGSSGADFVERTGAGMVYATESDLASTLRAVSDARVALGAASRHAYEDELSSSAWIRALVSLYRSVAGGS